MKDVRFSFSKCSLTRSMGIVGNKWKPIIVYVLQKRKVRFGQLDALIPLITRKVLTEQLKELEDDGVIVREAFSEIPPRVEYSLTEKGLELLPILNSIILWNEKYETEPQESYCTTSSFFKELDM
ncbi:winged helix-turn-helix transcriptional regulator [Pedobacter sp. 22163]|uniref:winged helix-turn-helix transcriptional regulator n=1 Tax=Pedobacter sp. 22163 TaxID=3453883 RepID=UPI003F872961